MSETAPVAPSNDGRVNDPAKALDMAYAGKFDREQAVGLANALEKTINEGETAVTDPYFMDETGTAKQKYSVPQAVELADNFNAVADSKETQAGEAYDKRKAEADAAAAHLEAIKAGKRIVKDQEGS